MTCIHNLDVQSWLAYLLGSINAIQGFVTTIGNLIVILIFAKNQHLRKKSNFCLISLAATDLMVGCILEPLHVVQLFSVKHRNDCVLNAVRRFLATVFMGASIGFIAIISYDRCIRLRATINYDQQMSKLKITLLIVLCWMVSLAIPCSRFASEAAYNVIAVVYVVSITVVMISCYVTIISIVKNRRKFISMSKKMDKAQSNSIKRHIRAAKVVSLIIAVLIITTAPIAIYSLVLGITRLVANSEVISETAREITYALLMTSAMTSSGINPFVYYFRMPEYKSCLQKYWKNLFSEAAKTDFKARSSNEVKTMEEEPPEEKSQL